MAELVVGAFVTVLIEKLASGSSQYLLDFIRSVGVDELLKEWSTTLERHRDVLEDAEEKQLTNREVRCWLDDLHDLLYDVDDFVDELAYEAQARRIKRASTSRFPNCIPTASLINNCGINPASFKFNRKMKPKIEEISRRLQDISQRRVLLELKQINIRGRETGVTVQLPTTSFPPSRVIGREKEKEEIVKMLMKPEAHSAQVPVITILGMGGMGKTTLAQHVYQDKQVESFFDLRAWVCVSDVFDVAGIMRAILKSKPSTHTKKTENEKTPCLDNTETVNTEKLDLNQLHEKLKQMLSGKKFLVVLDDIWNENYGKWEILLRPFPFGPAEVGSRILTTTRNETVASTMSLTRSWYHLTELGDSDCLSLLATHALGRDDFDLHLKESGKQIVEKCGRLPLAIKTVAGLLRSKPRLQGEWEAVINSNKWKEGSDGILPALRVSYYHLPSHLKRCFAYCSIIPKDYIFDKNDLVLLWMAEGFLEQPSNESSKQIEDFGHDCFQELLSRSFFQLTNGSTTKFIMHDLINDLAVHVAGERCFRMDDEWDENREYKISVRTRHFSFSKQSYEVAKKFDVFKTAHRTRTFLSLQQPHRYKFYISKKVLASTMSRLQSLRVLDLSYSLSVKLPNTIGALKHLRYLNLSDTSIKKLPQLVCSLYNLQTLSLNDCKYLRELPSSIGCLTNLRHLELERTPNLRKMPSGIGKLTSLQTLSTIIVGKNIRSCNLKDLKDLRYLNGTLLIKELQNVTDDRDAVAADLRSKEHLEILQLEWSLEESVGSADHVKQVLENLQPHCNLKELEIKGYGGVEFPSWVGGQSMSNVVRIHLRNCSKITYLPPLGELPLLKDLVIEGLDSIASVGAEFYGGCAEEIAFPSLETLTFCKMGKWKELSPPGAGKRLFPRLRYLEINDCGELGSIATTLELPCLCSLRLWRCRIVWLERLVNLTSLKTMTINDVAGLTCLPEQFVNSVVSLEEGKFGRCNELDYVFGDNPFNRLNRLHVYECDNLISLVKEGEHGLPSNLEVLILERCSKLKKLPNGLNGLASLEVMEINYCPSLVWDATDRLPKSLIHLVLINCTKSWVLSNLGFHRLTSLRELIMIGFKDVVSFEQVGVVGEGDSNSTSTSYLFPPSLTKLFIGSFPNLESLSNSLQNLTSLRELEIYHCPKLESLAGADDHQASLHIISSLHSLRIAGRSLEVLRKHCKKEEGKYWPIIQHIPELYIDI